MLTYILVLVKEGLEKPVVAIRIWEDYQAIPETLDILGDKKAVEMLHRSIEEVKEEKAIPWKDAKARLGA